MSERTVGGRSNAWAAVDGATLPDLPSEAAVLVSGPPMTGKYELLLSLLARQADRAIVISTKHAADRVLDDYRRSAGGADPAVGVVDCVRRRGSVDETETVKYAHSPENLTRIGVKFTELYELFEDGSPVAVGLHSLSQLLMHAEVEGVYRFLGVLTGHVRSAGWFQAAVLDASVVDEEGAATIRGQFDGVIETREGESGRREYRVRGFGPDGDWTPF